MYQTLPKSYKNKYPFKLATTSFIYPDHYAPNVRMLGPYFDEIELLLFESNPSDVLPSNTEILELHRLAEEFELSYNIHLPTDISISASDPTRQQQAVEALTRIIDLVSPLSPTSYCLHIPFAEDPFAEEKVKRWQERVYGNLEKILETGVKAELIAVETLAYPFELLDPIVYILDLGICMDMGHLLLYEYNIESVFKKCGEKTSIIHLHGVENSKDHLPLNRLSKKTMGSVTRILSHFTGVVSLEVFSFDDLNESLPFLEHSWKNT